MKIGFDAKRLFNNFTGLGNYSRFVVDALLKHVPENEYLLYTPRTRRHAEIDSISDHSKITIVTPPFAYRLFKASSLWRSWGVSAEQSIGSLNVFHGLSQELPLSLPSRVKKVVTVHDLIFLRYPKFYNPIDVAIYKAKVKHACKTAQKIISISEQTASDLVHFLNVPQQKIVTVYQGCHPQFKKVLSASEILKIRKKHRLPEQYLLNVGTIEARKNVILIIRALSRIPKENRLPLVIVGRETEYKREIVIEALQRNVWESIIFLHDIPFTDFPAIYQGAKLFVYPSLFEGFGIPLVEAIESGIPVITSNGSCFSEAAGPSSIYVEPTNAEELAFQINRVVHDSELREKMVNEGQRYTKRFLPSQIANDLLSVYNA